MVATGETAPLFELPAVVDGEIGRVALEDHLGTEIVVLAFYPSDFNPACGDGTTGLDELDLFTMQKDVAILGISADSVHSHRAFAAEYDLHVPLLADVEGAVARDYGVRIDDPDAGYLTRRAVVVVGPDGEVASTWLADDPCDLPEIAAVRDAVAGLGSDDTAASRYRVAHAHYVEGRRALTSGMGAFVEREWLLAQTDFNRAHREFGEAADGFDTAVRFAEDEAATTHSERAERKTRALWQAAEWLTDAASAYATGEGVRGEQLRRDAEAPLETARTIHEPPEPDGFPPPVPVDRTDETPVRSPAPGGDDTPSLGLDIERAASEPTDCEDGEPEDGIDEADIEEITAELEAQSAATEEAASGTGEEGDEETDGETNENADIEGGDHGVPDSL